MIQKIWASSENKINVLKWKRIIINGVYRMVGLSKMSGVIAQACILTPYTIDDYIHF
jgi:hypothetical protein